MTCENINVEATIKMDAPKKKVRSEYPYPMETPLRKRVETITREVYWADGVSWAPEAEAKGFSSSPCVELLFCVPQIKQSEP
jgi:formyltetrahydrofolate synthetase